MPVNSNGEFYKKNYLYHLRFALRLRPRACLFRLALEIPHQNETGATDAVTVEPSTETRKLYADVPRSDLQGQYDQF